MVVNKRESFSAFKVERTELSLASESCSVSKVGKQWSSSRWSFVLFLRSRQQWTSTSRSLVLFLRSKTEWSSPSESCFVCKVEKLSTTGESLVLFLRSNREWSSASDSCSACKVEKTMVVNKRESRSVFKVEKQWSSTSECAVLFRRSKICRQQARVLFFFRRSSPEWSSASDSCSACKVEKRMVVDKRESCSVFKVEKNNCRQRARVLFCL